MKVRKLKKSVKLILLLLIIGTLGMFYFKEPAEDNLGSINEPIPYTNIKESDADIVKEFFAKGMSKAHYKDAVEGESTKLTADTAYQKTTYDFGQVLSYATVEVMIKNLNASKAVQVEIIGKSVDKRSIYSIAVGFGEKSIMFETGIHAAEVANTMFIMKYLNDLVNEYEAGNQEIIDLLNEVKILVIPGVNPDGYEATLFGYKNIKNQTLYLYKNHDHIKYDFYKGNANGIDLNRAMPSQHGGLYYSKYKLAESVSMTPSIGDYDYYSGSTLGSEPETKALIYWQTKYFKDAYAYIALHSQGQVIYAGKPNLSTKFNENSLALANIVSEINEYVVFGPDDEAVGQGDDGTATDFVAELICGFTFSSKTGRLAADSYENPTIKETQATGVITLETMLTYTRDISLIKQEYYNKKLNQVFDALIKSYQKIK